MSGEKRPFSDQPAQSPRTFLGHDWECLPWSGIKAQLPHGVGDLLEKTGRYAFRSKLRPELYLIADYDPDVCRLLAEGVTDIRRAALRAVRNLLEDAGFAETELEEALEVSSHGR